ncbi:MAG: alkaline phosphatase family protein [Dehalococcoidia bacterium]|nr:alkaline phosphatase family protein [Dehalococcoidia bacterium]
MAHPPRVLMIGLDALDYRLLAKLCSAGRLPNLDAFTASAHSVDVTSDGAILHGSVWPTFASGAGPGSHGIYFWTQWLAEEMRHVRNNHPAFAYEPWWNHALDSGLDVTVVDVPYVPAISHPHLRQYIGWGLHDEIVPIRTPASFAAEVEHRFGKHPLEFDTLEPQTPHDKLVMARDMRRGVHLRARLIRWLLQEGRSNLIVTAFSELHKAGHYLAAPQRLSSRYTNIDALAAILQPFDAALPSILATAGPSTSVILFALHGMSEQADYSDFGQQLVGLVNGHEPADQAANPDLVRRIRDILPDSLHRAVWKRLPASVRAARQGQLAVGNADFAHDAIFTITHDGHAAFRINEKGREFDGIVPPANSGDILQKLWGLASGMRAEDGRNAFTEIYRPQAMHAGPRAHRLPDAMLIANSEVRRTNRLETPDGRVLFSSRPEARNGIHTNRGFCFYRAAEGGPAAVQGNMDNRDFGPTALALLGLPVPASLRGRSILA